MNVPHSVSVLRILKFVLLNFFSAGTVYILTRLSCPFSGKLQVKMHQDENDRSGTLYPYLNLRF